MLYNYKTPFYIRTPHYIQKVLDEKTVYGIGLVARQPVPKKIFSVFYRLIDYSICLRSVLLKVN